MKLVRKSNQKVENSGRMHEVSKALPDGFCVAGVALHTRMHAYEFATSSLDLP
ncbi:hypothetical protein BT96DRAFT_925084 [Gymnopus androsaceus JB14]|uniref:Uncharacterized protein n=1 Tax=Gymnopus androsaceus JB14 TaxID=1447944 RepID=A0A6A4H0K6_9AGAR|nr:hypothetical protein BT96DRAFT_925084 [Gymnopus androsaceus JB14]